jgi:hypothetical protein
MNQSLLNLSLASLLVEIIFSLFFSYRIFKLNLEINRLLVSQNYFEWQNQALETKLADLTSFKP